jgi:cell division protein FtsW (lipid II flippase)
VIGAKNGATHDRRGEQRHAQRESEKEVMDALIAAGLGLLVIAVVSAVVAPMRTIKVIVALLLVGFCALLVLAVLVGVMEPRR